MLVPSKTADPYRQYRGNQVFTSSPTELVVMLLTGAALCPPGGRGAERARLCWGPSLPGPGTADRG